MIKKSLLALLPVAALAIGWYFVQSENTSPRAVSDDPASASSHTRSTADPLTTVNPLATETDAARRITGSANNTSTSSHSNTADLRDVITGSAQGTSANEIETSTVAVEPLSDAEFIRLEQLLKNDSELRLSLLDEFRNNTDPARAKQLATLLGPYDDPEILQVASELAYSGDPQSRIAGLDLLRRIQPRNDAARDIAIELLSTGENAETLVATMNVLATPSRNASDSQLQILNDNLNNLSNHYDPGVRSHSIALLGRWDKNSSVARDALSRGLTDPEPHVRSSATFAIININDPDEAMIDGLLSIAEDTDEIRSTRYAALRALDSMQLTATQRRRYADAQRSANSRY